MQVNFSKSYTGTSLNSKVDRVIIDFLLFLQMALDEQGGERIRPATSVSICDVNSLLLVS